MKGGRRAKEYCIEVVKTSILISKQTFLMERFCWGNIAGEEIAIETKGPGENGSEKEGCVEGTSEVEERAAE